MGITALIAGGLSAVGSVASSVIGSNAAQNASAQQVAQQQRALDQQRQMFGVAQGALNPFITAGTNLLPTYEGLLTPGPNQNALLQQTPGFQFASQYGTKSATNALAARGQGASAGPLATAVSQFNNGLAQDTWQKTINALYGGVGIGANAAGSLAGNAINSGNSIAGTFGNIGTAQAAGTLGSANALSGGISGVTGSITNAALYNRLFGSGSGGGGGIYGDFSGPAYGGGNALTDAWGGSPSNPLSGLTAADYG